MRSITLAESLQRRRRRVFIDGHIVEEMGASGPFGGIVATYDTWLDLKRRLEEAPAPGSPRAGCSILTPAPGAGGLAAKIQLMAALAASHDGLLGRTPDYLSSVLSAFDAYSRTWRDDEAAERVRAYVDFYRETEPVCTHAVVDPPPGDGACGGLRKVADRGNHIVVRGYRLLATLAPIAEELLAFPCVPIENGDGDRALAFAVDIDVRGLHIVCRDTFRSGEIAERYDEHDAVLYFDDVAIPRERVFIDGSVETFNGFIGPGFVSASMTYDAVRAIAKLRLFARLAASLASRSRVVEHDRAAGEIDAYLCATESMLRDAVQHAEEYWDRLGPNASTLQALRALLPGWFTRIQQLLTSLAGPSALGTTTAMAPEGLSHPVDLAELGTALRRPEEQLLRALLVDGFGGRALLYEQYHHASAARNFALLHQQFRDAATRAGLAWPAAGVRTHEPVE